MKTHFIVPIAVSLATMATVIRAEEPALITDRPDFTESAVTVPRTSVQFEGGFTWDHDDGTNSFTLPELLVRWGVAERIELRFGLPNVEVIDPDTGDRMEGLGDGSIGAKIAFGGGHPGGWDVGVIVSASLPTGEDDFTSDAIDPGVILAAGRDIGPGWSLGAQIQADWPTVVEERELVWGGTVVVGRALGERTGAFFEVASSVPERGEASTVLHHGYTIAVTPLFQIDVHGGFGLSDAAPDTFAGAGFAIRM